MDSLEHAIPGTAAERDLQLNVSAAFLRHFFFCWSVAEGSVGGVSSDGGGELMRSGKLLPVVPTIGNKLADTAEYAGGIVVWRNAGVVRKSTRRSST